MNKMSQEDKDLLLKDLCARLPYGVMIEVYGESQSVTEVLHNITDIGNVEISYTTVNIETIKPYLRPMSSMTEEEIKELLNIDTKRGIFSSRHLTWHIDGEIIDYLNEKMFDYRGLIEKGLALEAPDNMYKHFGDMDIKVNVEYKGKF